MLPQRRRAQRRPHRDRAGRAGQAWVVLAVSRGDAVLSATTGRGCAVPRCRAEPEHRADAAVDRHAARGLALCVSTAPPRLRRLGIALVLLFARSMDRLLGLAGRGPSRDSAAPSLLRSLLGPIGRDEARRCVAVLCALAVVLRHVSSKAPERRRPSPTTPHRRTSPVVATRGIDAEHVVRLEDEIGFPSTRSFTSRPRRGRCSARAAARRPGTAPWTRERERRSPATGSGRRTRSSPTASTPSRAASSRTRT